MLSCHPSDRKLATSFKDNYMPYFIGPSAPLAQALARNSSHQCEVRNCARKRFKLGRFCRDHALTYIQSGHSVALSIHRRTWRPFFAQAHAFVVDQLRKDHPSIEAALYWVAREIEHAKRPTIYQPAYLGYASFLLKAHRNGVSPTDFVARAIAPYLADDRGREVGPRFLDDTHFAHQAARLYLHPFPIGPSGWSPRKREQQDPPEVSRIRWRVRACTHERVTAALGKLTLRATEHIRSTSTPLSSSSTHQRHQHHV